MASNQPEADPTINHTRADPVHLANPLSEPSSLPETAEDSAASKTGDFGDLVGSQIGDYIVLDEIGRGGMGVIFKARHATLGRVVALKLIRSDELADEEQIQRFQAEAQAAAQLDHPGIVTVYETGRHGRRHFMAMAFVEGRSLNHRAAQTRFSSREAALVVQRAAEALHYAHERGIVHRDIKPQNILYSDDGQPRIADFGLAKKQSSDHSLTATGAVLGTPAYMPPEQAAGQTNRVGAAADIYSLGATLYFLLTGKPPFQANHVVDLLMKVMDDAPEPPRQANPNVPTDLEAICLKCLAKRPEDRYASAAALADDLRRFLEGEAISVSSGGWGTALMQTLTRSRDDIKYKDWALVLFEFAAIVGVVECIVFSMCAWDLPHRTPVIMLARIAQFSLMAWICWRHRVFEQTAANASAQQMISLWIGFIVACNVTALTVHQACWLLYPDKPLEVRICYPYFSSLSGLLFFGLGRNFWGACYAFGIAFFAMAVIMPPLLTYSPLMFGAAWAAILTTLGLRLRGLVDGGATPVRT